MTDDGASGSVSFGDADEVKVQADVLHFLMSQDPRVTHRTEVLRELVEPSVGGPYVADEVRQALRDLVHAGILHCLADDYYLATRATLHADALPR